MIGINKINVNKYFYHFLLFFSINAIFWNSQLNLRINEITYPLNRFKEASTWLKNNTNNRETIFNFSWSSYSQLYFWNTHNTFVCGLDPHMIYEYDKKLGNLYFEITNGITAFSLNSIKENFDADYLLFDKYDPNINKQLLIMYGDSKVKKYYADQYCIILGKDENF